LKFVRFIPLFFVFAGCLNEPDCLITSTNLVKISFKKSNNSARKILFNEITISGLDNDKKYQTDSVTSIQLPVTPAEGDITFTFSFESRVETLRLKYDTQTEIISPECGAFVNYINLDVADTSFEVVEILNNRLTLNAPVNVQIRVD